MACGLCTSKFGPDVVIDGEMRSGPDSRWVEPGDTVRIEGNLVRVVGLGWWHVMCEEVRGSLNAGCVSPLQYELAVGFRVAAVHREEIVRCIFESYFKGKQSHWRVDTVVEKNARWTVVTFGGCDEHFALPATAVVEAGSVVPVKFSKWRSDEVQEAHELEIAPETTVTETTTQPKSTDDSTIEQGIRDDTHPREHRTQTWWCVTNVDSVRASRGLECDVMYYNAETQELLNEAWNTGLDTFAVSVDGKTATVYFDCDVKFHGTTPNIVPCRNCNVQMNSATGQCDTVHYVRPVIEGMTA